MVDELQGVGYQCQHPEMVNHAMLDADGKKRAGLRCNAVPAAHGFDSHHGHQRYNPAQRKEMKSMRKCNCNQRKVDPTDEIIITINATKIRAGLGTCDDDSGKIYYCTADLAEIGSRVDAKFKNTTAHNTTAELTGWCPAPVWIVVTWHCALFASRLFRQIGDEMVEVV